jgi:hypothetical protein
VGTGSYQLAFADYVATSIPHFVSFGVGNLIETLSRFGFVAAVWLWAAIAVLRMETIIDVAMEVNCVRDSAATAAKVHFGYRLTVGESIYRTQSGSVHFLCAKNAPELLPASGVRNYFWYTGRNPGMSVRDVSTQPAQVPREVAMTR